MEVFTGTMEDVLTLYSTESNDRFPIRTRMHLESVRFRNAVCYLDDTVKTLHVAKLMENGDYSYGSEKINSFSFSVEGGKLSMLWGEAWGITAGNRTELEIQLNSIFTELTNAGIRPKRTGAATVATMLLSHAGDLGNKLYPLQPRFRAAAYGATHSGPMVHVRGYSPRASHIDRNSAYLKALYKPLPGLKDWTCVTKPSLCNAVINSKREGIIKGAVYVPYDEHTLQQAPLPVHWEHGFTVYPVGYVKGVWTLSMLRIAIELYGCEVKHIDWVATTVFKPWMASLADRLSALPKHAAKPLYTRVWGKCFTRGGWQGSVVPGPGSIREFNCGKTLLYLTDNKSPWYKRGMPRYHRPDLSAFICSDNHNAMIEAIRSTKPDTLIGAHVDAIWTEDNERAQQLVDSGDFKMVGEGRVRMYSQGRYAVSGDDWAYLGQSGIPRLFPDSLEGARSLERYCENELEAISRLQGVEGIYSPRGYQHKYHIRQWYGADMAACSPVTERDAKSAPLEMTDAMEPEPFDGLEPNTENVWKKNGQLRDKVLVMLGGK